MGIITPDPSGRGFQTGAEQYRLEGIVRFQEQPLFPFRRFFQEIQHKAAAEVSALVCTVDQPLIIDLRFDHVFSCAEQFCDVHPIPPVIKVVSLCRAESRGPPVDLYSGIVVRTEIDQVSAALVRSNGKLFPEQKMKVFLIFRMGIVQRFVFPVENIERGQPGEHRVGDPCPGKSVTGEIGKRFGIHDDNAPVL